MIEIKRNIENFYNTPQLKPGAFRSHSPENLAYKAALYLPDTFWANEACAILEEIWGVKVNPHRMGLGLRRLWEHHYVTRISTQGAYKYTKTPLYKMETEDTEYEV